MSEHLEFSKRVEEASKQLEHIRDFENLKPQEKMSQLWNKASRTYTVLKALEIEPDISQEELRQLIPEKIPEKMSENEAIFLGGIVHTMREIHKSVNTVIAAYSETGTPLTSLAEEICGEIYTSKEAARLGIKIDKNDPYVFEEPVKVSIGDYAVYIEMDSVDYVQINQERESGVIYAEARVPLPGQNIKQKVPVIMLKRDAKHEGSTTQQHEEGHLFNTIMSRARAVLPNSEFPELVAEVKQTLKAFKTKVKQISESDSLQDSSQVFEELKQDPGYEIMLDVLLDHYSDEITAEMYTGSHRHKIQRVKTNYNFVITALELKPESELAQLIKADLDERIDATTKSINSCYNQYLEYMPQRAALMPVLLQDIPVSKWRQTLEAADFFKEYSLIEKATQRLKNMEMDWADFHPEQLPLVAELKQELVEMLQENQLVSHVVEVRKFGKNVEKIQQRVG